MTDHSVTSPPAPLTPPNTVAVGVDTHSDVHVAVAVDGLGRRLGELAVPTTSAGSQDLERWASAFGAIAAFGIEGTAGWGANLSRYLRQHGHDVREINCPYRSLRRQRGKSDPVDAEAAARAVLAGTATVTAKSLDGHVEMIRSLHVVRRSAQKSRRQAANQLHALVVNAPYIVVLRVGSAHRHQSVAMYFVSVYSSRPS